MQRRQGQGAGAEDLFLEKSLTPGLVGRHPAAEIPFFRRALALLLPAHASALGMGDGALCVGLVVERDHARDRGQVRLGRVWHVEIH